MADPIPHLAFPLRFEDGVAVAVEQDSTDHMLDRIHVTVRTMLGDRLDDPTFGVPSELLRVKQVDLDVLVGAIAESEPDIPVTLTRATPQNPDPSGLPLPGFRDDIRVEIGGEATA